MVQKSITRFATLLVGLTLLLSGTLSAQNNDEEDRRDRTGIQLPATIGSTKLFVDEVGLQFLTDMVPGSGFFDPDTYIIGPQDVLTVDVKGPVSVNARALVVNPNGYLFMPYAGNIELAGLTIADATTKINEALRKELRDFELSLSVQMPRPVEVQIVGDVPFPGKYKLPAGARLDLAIFPAITEGELPSEGRNTPRYRSQFLTATNYSLRNISIERENPDLSTDGDLISYFSAGVQAANPYVYDGDIIHIRQVNEHSPRISVSGAVQNAQEIEYREDDSVGTLLRLSGGFRDGADRSVAKLYRRGQYGVTVQEVSLDDPETSDIMLEPDDRLIIPYLKDATRSASAWIYGEAINPGNYPIDNDETTLKELLDLAGGLTNAALPNAAWLLRSVPTDRQVPAATGVDTRQLMRTSNQIQQGFEYLEMEQQLGSERRMYINLKDERELEQIRLNDGDRLYIPRDYQNVVLYGQFNNPGNYQFDPGMSVSQYIEKAGGFSLIADTERLYVIKAGSRAWKNPEDTTIESGDMIFVDRVPFDELNAMRNYDLQLRNLRRSNLQLILTTVSTITAVITTYVAITR